MTTDLPPIPPAVVEFVKPDKYKKVFYEGKWKNYEVYYVSFPKDKGLDVGLPLFVIYDGNTVRYPNNDEFEDIWETEF